VNGANALVSDLQQPVVGQNIATLEVGSDGAEALTYNGNGLYVQIGATFTTPSGNQIQRNTNYGSSGKFVFFLGKSGMTGRHGRHVVARDIWSLQELPFHPDRDQAWGRIRGRRASGRTLRLSGLPKPGCDSARPENQARPNPADWFSSRRFGNRGAALQVQGVPACV
jgi:hypothetical protein